MTTYAELKRDILRLLGEDEESGSDPVAGEGVSAALLQDAVHAALEAITTRVWKRSKTTILTTTDPAVEDTYQFTLPTDLLDIEAVYYHSVGQFIPQLDMKVGNQFASGAGQAWILYPEGQITFTNEPDASLDIYYSALFTLPTDDDDVLDCPRAALTAVAYFAASYCRIPDASSAASIRQYNTKVDSGQPTDNPVAEYSDWLLKRYEAELQRLPMMKKERL